jgi:hypothetical protein
VGEDQQAACDLFLFQLLRFFLFFKPVHDNYLNVKPALPR